MMDDVSHDVLLVGVLGSPELGLRGLGMHVGSRFSHNSNIIYNYVNFKYVYKSKNSCLRFNTQG